MAENSGISWTDHTFNPWIGCTRISPACDRCYAALMEVRHGDWIITGVKGERYPCKPDIFAATYELA